MYILLDEKYASNGTKGPRAHPCPALGRWTPSKVQASMSQSSTMPLKHRRSEEYELLPRPSTDSIHSLSTSSHDGHHHAPSTSRSRLLQLLAAILSRLPRRPARALYTKLSGHRASRRPVVRWILWAIFTTYCIVFLLIVFTAAFRPSYTYPPEHYRTLQKRCQESRAPGRGNVNNEKVFIAATLYDPEGRLVGGGWGEAVLGLVDLLGPENVHLSIYENDADEAAQTSLEELQQKVTGGYLSGLLMRTGHDVSIQRTPP